jgi:hypothetical protein
MSVKTVYRSREQALGIALTWLVVPAVSIVSFLMPGPLSVPARAVGIGIMVALTCWCLLRVARSGVFLEDGGVGVLNPLRTVRIPWSQIRCFSLKRYKLFPLTGHVELKDGTSVHIFGIQAPHPLLRPRNQSAQRIVEALNERLRQRGSDD